MYLISDIDLENDLKVCPVSYGGMLLFNNIIPHRRCTDVYICTILRCVDHIYWCIKPFVQITEVAICKWRKKCIRHRWKIRKWPYKENPSTNDNMSCRMTLRCITLSMKRRTPSVHWNNLNVEPECHDKDSSITPPASVYIWPGRQDKKIYFTTNH